MKLSVLRGKAYDALSIIGLISITVGLCVFTAEMTDAARSGVELCWNVIIPSLFPFFVVSQLTVRLGLADKLGRLCSRVMRPLFGVSGKCAPALILGFIGGYPVGAKTVIALYTEGGITKTEAERMLAFSNNSGPAFILGVVGAGIFVDTRAGLVLYLAHFTASLIIGLFFKRYRKGQKPSDDTSFAAKKREPLSQAIVSSVSQAFSSSLGICGFVVFFTVLTRLIFLSGILGRLAELLSGIFGLSEELCLSTLTGIIELTGGVWRLREASDSIAASLAMAAFMLGWAGISVHCQVLSFLRDTGLSSATYIIGKLLHGILSALITLLISRFFSPPESVASILAEEVQGLSELDFRSTLAAALPLSAAVFLIFLCISLFSAKKAGKRGQNGL